MFCGIIIYKGEKERRRIREKNYRRLNQIKWFNHHCFGRLSWTPSISNLVSERRNSNRTSPCNIYTHFEQGKRTNVVGGKEGFTTEWTNESFSFASRSSSSRCYSVAVIKNIVPHAWTTSSEFTQESAGAAVSPQVEAEERTCSAGWRSGEASGARAEGNFVAGHNPGNVDRHIPGDTLGAGGEFWWRSRDWRWTGCGFRTCPSNWHCASTCPRHSPWFESWKIGRGCHPFSTMKALLKNVLGISSWYYWSSTKKLKDLPSVPLP